jgi:catechol 2,3-dioxygenase-like lactoylglutathione lyase family enzyme
MSITEAISKPGIQAPKPQQVDLKFEAVVIPVSDVDRAKTFYGSLGWRLDADFPFDNGFRVVQFTPPGSECSIHFGTKLTNAAPGSAKGLYLIVSDIAAAHDELVARGVKVSEVFHAKTPGAQFQADDKSGRVSGPAPDHGSYRSFATFSEPDGNGWLLQRSQRGCLAGSTLPKRHLHPRPTWPAHFGVRRRRTASTKSGPASAMQTGLSGTPRT